MSNPRSLLHLPTSWGVIEVEARDGKIVRCQLPSVGDRALLPFQLKGRSAMSAPAGDRVVLRAAERYVAAALRGRAAKCPPLDDAAGGDFVRRVRRYLRRVARGRTCSYGELAAAAGSPRAARAAGSACATNPLPLFIPCHRVLAAGGRLGGFSGGLAWKKMLLEREGAT